MSKLVREFTSDDVDCAFLAMKSARGAKRKFAKAFYEGMLCAKSYKDGAYATHFRKSNYLLIEHDQRLAAMAESGQLAGIKAERDRNPPSFVQRLMRDGRDEKCGPR